MELVLGSGPGVRKRAAARSNKNTCSLLLQPFTGPHHTVRCEPEWPWSSDTSERQAYIDNASRSLTDTETRYAQIEKEMLAIVSALERFNQYGHIESDHEPLGIILLNPLARAPRRLQLW